MIKEILGFLLDNKDLLLLLLLLLLKSNSVRIFYVNICKILTL